MQEINEARPFQPNMQILTFTLLEQGKLRTQNPCKIAQKTAFEEKGRQNTAGKVIQRLFNIDL